MPLIQKRVATLGALAVLIVAVACTDLGPTPPASARVTDSDVAAVRLGGGFSATGRVTATIRRLDVGGPLGAVQATETGHYSASIAGDGATTGSVTFDGHTSEIVILASDKPTRRGKSWQRSFGARADAGALTVHIKAAAGAPAAEWEVRRRGVVVTRTADTWKRLNGAWVLTQSVTTTYQGSRPVVSVTIDFQEPAIGAPLRAPMVQASLAATDRVAAQVWSVCASEMYGVEKSFEVYEAASLGIISCIKGPLACLAAGTAYTLAYLDLRRAFEKADVCLDAV